MGVILTGICYLGIDGIVSSFLTQPEAFDYGVKFSQILLTTSFLFGPLYCLINALQVMGAAVPSLIINVSRQGLIYIPAVYLLNYTLGINGVVWAQPVADILAVLLSIILYAFVLRKQKQAVNHVQIQKENDGIESGTIIDEASSGRPIIITIGRSYGAGGRSIGKKVAEKLNIPFYDKEILLSVAEESGLNQQFLERIEENASPYAAGSYPALNVFLTNRPSQAEDIAYKAQKAVIEQIAANGSCVIIGRRADQILRRNGYRIFSIFITAPKTIRVSHIAVREGLTLEASEKKVRRVDKKRADYYNSLSDDIWGMADSYNLCINMEKIDSDEAAEMIAQVCKKREV